MKQILLKVKINDRGAAQQSLGFFIQEYIFAGSQIGNSIYPYYSP